MAANSQWEFKRSLAFPTGSACAMAPAMSHMVQCIKLGREAEGLPKPPLKGAIGEKIFNEISAEGWRMWLEHSKMLINELRLDLTDEKAQKYWFQEMEKYFWGEGSALPPEFKST